MLSESVGVKSNLGLTEAAANDGSPSAKGGLLRKLLSSVPLSPRRIALLYYHRAKKMIRKMQEYHVGVLFCAIASGTVFVINLSLTLWASRAYDMSQGLGTIYDGSCSRTNRLATWLHLAIMCSVLSYWAAVITQCSVFRLPLAKRLTKPTAKTFGSISEFQAPGILAEYLGTD